MEIKKIHTNNMRNDRHFQYITEVIVLVKLVGSGAIKVIKEFAALEAAFRNEDAAFKKIIRNAKTAEIETADLERDHILRGMLNAFKSALDHYDPDTVKAAKRVEEVCSTYGTYKTIASKPYDEETAAITNMTQDLTGKYAADVATTGLTAWVAKLDAKNKEFARIWRERQNENSAKTTFNLKQCRAETDRAYQTMIKRVNAFLVVEDKDDYEEFVIKMNALIEKFNNIVAVRLGKSKAKSKKKGAASETETGDEDK
jgi:hypothetical protein